MQFDLPVTSEVDFAIYDVRGRLVRRAIENRNMPAGRYDWIWDGKNDAGSSVRAGIYFYRLQTPLYTASKKVVISP